MKRVAWNLPGIFAILIIVAFSADLPLFQAWKTEATFGWWVVVLVPVSVGLIVAQIGLWVGRSSSRPWGTH